MCVAQSVGSFRAPPPPPSLDKRESGAHPGRLAFVLGFCTTVSPLRHLVVRGLAQLRNDDSRLVSFPFRLLFHLSCACCAEERQDFISPFVDFRMCGDECGGGGE
jgi:hypothetical protein